MKYLDDLTSSTGRLQALAEPSSIAAIPAEAMRCVMTAANQLVARAQGLRVALAAHFSAAGTFRADGATDTAAWLRTNNKLSGRAAREIANAARAMNTIPALADALRNGSASTEHAALLAPLSDRMTAGTVDPSMIAPLVLAASHESPDFFRARVRAAEIAAQADDGCSQAVRQRDNSKLRLFDGGDGMKVIRAELDPERAARIMNGIDAIVDELWRIGHADDTSPPRTHELPKLRVEALAETARRSLAGTAAAPDRRSRRGDAQVVVHIDLCTLLHDINRVDRTCHLDDGTPVPAETARRIACNAGLIPVVLGGPSEPLGRRPIVPARHPRTTCRVASPQRDLRIPRLHDPHIVDRSAPPRPMGAQRSDRHRQPRQPVHPPPPRRPRRQMERRTRQRRDLHPKTRWHASRAGSTRHHLTARAGDGTLAMGEGGALRQVAHALDWFGLHRAAPQGDVKGFEEHVAQLARVEQVVEPQTLRRTV